MKRAVMTLVLKESLWQHDFAGKNNESLHERQNLNQSIKRMILTFLNSAQPRVHFK